MARLKEKGLQVNIGKTKVMNCRVGVGQVENSGKYPCGICRKGVGRNSARLCTSCKKWIHTRCGGVVGRLAKVWDFKCRNCSEGGAKVVNEVRQFVLEAGEELEVVDKFCYLGDVIGKGGGAEAASRSRVRCAWGKFRDLRMLLTVRGASLRLKGKTYRACVQRVLVYHHHHHHFVFRLLLIIVHTKARVRRVMEEIWLGGGQGGLHAGKTQV